MRSAGMPLPVSVISNRTLWTAEVASSWAERETHPASVADAADGPSLAARLDRSDAADALAPVLRAPPAGLPSGAAWPYQVTVRVPTSISPATNISVSLMIAGFGSNRVTIPVR